MKRKKRGWVWFLVVVAALAAAAFILPALLNPGNTGLTVQRYEVAEAARGDIEVTVHGTGSIEAMETAAVFPAAAGTVESVLVENGDAVVKGQLIARLKPDALEEKIDSLREQIVTQDAAVAALRAAPAVKTLAAPVKGRVMAVYAGEGEDAAQAMSAHGALLTLSADGRMKVTFTPAEGATLEAGQAVKLEIGDKTADGFLTAVPDGAHAAAEAVIPTDKFDEGAQATVKDASGAVLGSGALEANRPLFVTAYTGTVDRIYVKKGDEVNAGARLVRLEGTALSAGFEAQLVKRQQLQDELDEAYASLADLAVTAPADGIVTDLKLQEGGLAQAGAAACSIQQTGSYKLVVAVDELDIPQIRIGQKASVAVDALPGGEASGEVVRITPVGVKTNDVTTYDVTLKVEVPEGAMVRMSAAADIQVAFKSDALLVPVEAVYTVNGKTWVYGALPADIRPASSEQAEAAPRFGLFNRNGRRAGAGEQRPMIEVRVGLVSDTWAEILEGLEEGDEVAVPSVQNDLGSMFGFGRGTGMREGGGSNDD